MSDVGKQLSPFVSHVLSDAGWRSALTDIVQTLRKAELVEPNELRLTNKGRTETLARLSLKEIKGEISWPAFLAEVVVPAALGLDVESVELKTADDLVAVLLIREYALSVSGKPTLPRVLNAMVWKALGVDSDQRLTAGALQRATLQKHLEGTRVKEPERLARILAAKVSGARAAGPTPARQAILRDWLTGADRQRSGEPEPVMADNMRIESFAEAALHAARDPQTIRFGEHKAFIDSVFERYRTRRGGPPMELPVFKKKLVAAHRRGLLTLARADLVEAMDRERVAASETHYLNTTFHFVEAD